MKRHAEFVLLAAALLALAGCMSLEAPHGRGGAARYQKAVDAVYPALVRIKVVAPIFREGREIRVQAGGSGVIISPEGHVVTNHHVAGKATSIVCVLSNKEEVRAERVGTDPTTDICVLRLLDQRTFPCARFGDSSRLQVGDTVLAMGSPGSISQSVTAGVASNVDLILPYGRLRLDGENVGALVKWVAHDAAIFPGNSGGPLVNLDGEVIGINEIALGLGGAIPSNLVRAVVDVILRSGAPARSRLGVVVQPLLKSSGRSKGVLVSGVTPDGPAAKGGLRPGDIILSYNGTPITARFAEDLPVFNRLISATPPGRDVALVVDRDKKQKTLTVRTELRERAMADTHEVRDWGMAARDLTQMLARAMKRESADGVLVVTTRPGGPCAGARPGINSRDVIVEMNGRPVKNVSDLIAATAKIVAGGKEEVPTLVAFDRKNERWLTLVKVGIRDLRDRSPEARKAWLPASYQVLTTELAAALKLGNVAGVRLTDVFKGRSAEAAGLRVGDIITAIDGDAIRASRPEHLDLFPAMVRQRRVGQTVKLSVIRDGRRRTVPVTLERSPKATREMKRYRDVELGFTVRDLSDEDRRTEKIEKGVAGPVVSEVQRGSRAAVAGLRVSDIVLSVDGRPTRRVSALKRAMTDLRKTKPPRVVFFVKRGIVTLFVEAETPWPAKTK